MSKSVGKMLGGNIFKKSSNGYANSFIDYLKKYDTSNVDTAQQNMATTAKELSSNLSNRPDYVYSVDGSDAAAQRAEQAMYNQTMSKLTPSFESRRRELETRLQNQGFSPTSEAYQSAMESLENSQNDAYINAAQNSILTGQNAYTNSLNNQISAANFQNSARQLPIAEIANLLSGQQSGLDIQNLIYNTGNPIDKSNYAAQSLNSMMSYNTGKAALGTAGAFIFSDEELKEDIVPVGRLHNGLTVYLFTYKGDVKAQLGLLAQEVLQIHPEAVAIDKSGYLKVNYALACQ